MCELLVASGSINDDEGAAMTKVFVGHDWAEAHHDVHVEVSFPRSGGRVGCGDHAALAVS